MKKKKMNGQKFGKEKGQKGKRYTEMKQGRCRKESLDWPQQEGNELELGET